MDEALDEAERASGLIADIYDAALDPTLWVATLEKTCNYVGGIASALQSHDMLQRSACFYFTWNDNPEYTKAYVEKYAGINPAIVPATIQTQVGEVSTFLDFVPLEEYRASQLYKEWAAPQGYIDAVQAVLDKSATSYAAAVVMRHERHGPADAGARRRMLLLAPHFRRAVNIGKIIDLKKVEAAALADTLDGLAAGMFLVDSAGSIVHANAAGNAALAEETVAQRAAGKLALVDPDAQRTLREIFIAVRDGDAAIGSKGIAVPLNARDGERWVAHVLPLTSGTRRKAGQDYSAVAAVFVRKAAFDLPHPMDVISNAFKLTPAEMRILMMIVQVGGVPEIARVLGISETTVKTHLQHVFEKTGTQRQADLVKLVASYMSPLAA
jgi:DNA-binding CsgD family transcriptional regulator